MIEDLLVFLNWSGWQHIGTVALLLTGVPALSLPFTYARDKQWKRSLASRSLMFMYAGIAAVYAYLFSTALFGPDYPGRTLARLAVFLPFGYGIWRMWFTHFRYMASNDEPTPAPATEKDPA